METYEAKRALRKDMASLKRSFSKTILSGLSDKIITRIEECDLFRQAERVALYHALPDEAGTAPLIERWYREKALYLPVVTGDDLRFLRYEGERSVSEGAYHILEPICGEEVDMREIDLIIVPGVAFDRQGNRLGRGKGYYDRTLSQVTAPKIGICFHFQFLDEIPAEPFDIRMDRIITDKEEFAATTVK